MKSVLPKINSNRYGGLWIGAGLLVGLVIPIVLWFVLHRVVWPLVIAGGVILTAFWVLFAIEMHQDNGAVPFFERTLPGTIPYDPEKQDAIIRCSICTGEKVAGFKNKADGHFTEVMLIRSPREEERFKQMYHLDSVRTEY